jgi:hypothetical protein
MAKSRSFAWILLGLFLIGNIGCCVAFVPIPPWVGQRLDEKYTKRWKQRAALMPPILPGQPLPTCEDEPTDEEVIRALPKVLRGCPFVVEEFRDYENIIVEKLTDCIDPPVHMPLVGAVQVHHCHYKCTVFWKERWVGQFPFPYDVTNNRVEVVYIDKDHMHAYVCNDPAALRSFTRDLSGPTLSVP